MRRRTAKRPSPAPPANRRSGGHNPPAIQRWAASPIRSGPLKKVAVTFGVGSRDLSELATFGEFLARIRTRCLEQLVAHRAAGNINHDERLRDQVRDIIDDVRNGDLDARRDRNRCLQAKAVSEDGKATEHEALALREQGVAPVECRSRCPMPQWRSAATAGEQLETIVEMGRYPFHPERSGAGGRELDGQRNAVEATADCRGDRRDTLVPREVRIRRTDPRDEQLNRTISKSDSACALSGRAARSGTRHLGLRIPGGRPRGLRELPLANRARSEKRSGLSL